MSRPGWFEFIESDNQEETGLNEEAVFPIMVPVTMKKERRRYLNLVQPRH